MQPNEITLTVDEANDGSTTPDIDHMYQRFDTFSTRSVFNETEHTEDLRKTLSFYRTSAKANGLFRGTRKSAFKFTTDIQVVGTDGVSLITSPIITEVKISLPLGATEAQAKLERQKALALLDNDSVASALMSSLSI